MPTPEREALARLADTAESYLAFSCSELALEQEIDKARAAISSQPPAPSWQPIETAPKDGMRFVNMYYVTVVGVGLPMRHERHFQICHRAFSSLGSPGYWTNEHASVPDHCLHGWWLPLAHPLPSAPQH